MSVPSTAATLSVYRARPNSEVSPAAISATPTPGRFHTTTALLGTRRFTRQPMSTPPNITIQSGHNVINDVNNQLDQVVVQAGGIITINASTTLTIASGKGANGQSLDIQAGGSYLDNFGTFVILTNATVLLGNPIRPSIRNRAGFTPSTALFVQQWRHLSTSLYHERRHHPDGHL